MDLTPRRQRFVLYCMLYCVLLSSEEQLGQDAGARADQPVTFPGSPLPVSPVAWVSFTLPFSTLARQSVLTPERLKVPLVSWPLLHPLTCQSSGQGTVGCWPGLPRSPPCVALVWGRRGVQDFRLLQGRGSLRSLSQPATGLPGFACCS